MTEYLIKGDALNINIIRTIFTLICINSNLKTIICS